MLRAERDRLRGLLARCLSDCEFWDSSKPGNGLDLRDEVRAAVNPPNLAGHGAGAKEPSHGK